jgi:NADH:ubiquinone oxidoreductase subunit K
MNAVWAPHFLPFATAGALLFISGLYCILMSRNLIRILIGMELLTKAVTLMLVLAGAVTGRTEVMQALVITLIVIEVVVITVAAGIVIGAYRQNGSIDAKALTDLKG